ncbi:MAG: putative signal transduction histidine kinase [Micavibrio sp.]|nr:putative signal transduction histidine kinase [Micavibrio sp.]
MATMPQKNAAEAGTAVEASQARVVIDDHGRIVFATPNFSELSGVPSDALRGQPLSALLTFSDPEEAFHAQKMFGSGAAETSDAAAMIRSLREGVHPVLFGTRTAELHFDRIGMKDGRSFVVASLADDSGAVDSNFLELIARMEQKAEANSGPVKSSSDTDLRHFLNMSHDLQSVADATGRFIKVGDNFFSVLGYSDDELKKTSLLDIVHPDDKPQARNTLSSLMYDDAEQNSIIDCECRVMAKDGSIRWMEWRHKRAGDIIYSVGRDVTAFKTGEDAMRQQELMLREAQAIGHMGHWRWSVGSNDIQWSDEIYKIFGVERGTFVPALDAVNRMTHKRDVGRLLQAFQRAIIEQNNYEMEFRITRPDGEVRYIRCEGRCEHDPHGDVIALFGIMQDVTERTINELNLTEAKDAAERAYAAKSQFLANMSHELRTPLNAIIGFSEMMQRQLLGPIGSARYLDYIAGIRESGEHLLDLISDILDMSKIEAGKYELDLEELHVAKVIRLAIHMMEGRATDAKIHVSIDITNEGLQVVADRRALMQVLLNLLSNAVKFTEPGGSVRVECIERGDYVSIKVHDTGIGIPANQLKNITRPFEQAASHYTRKHEGTGLGLAITKELIELHGGSLHIDSTVGVGTTVTIRLPYNAYEALKKKTKS